MADIANATNTGAVVESIQQHTAPAAEDIQPRSAVRLDGTTGKFTAANATAAGEAGIYGISTNTKVVKAGQAVTAIRRGVMDGFDFSQNFGAAIYLSNTDGKLGDAAGTVSVRVGQVVSAWSQPLGTVADKLLSIEL